MYHFRLYRTSSIFISPLLRESVCCEMVLNISNIQYMYRSNTGNYDHANRYYSYIFLQTDPPRTPTKLRRCWYFAAPHSYTPLSQISHLFLYILLHFNNTLTGAKNVVFVLDTRERCVNKQVENALDPFMGPALLQYDDVVFSPKDFTSLTSTGKSEKKVCCLFCCLYLAFVIFVSTLNI